MLQASTGQDQQVDIRSGAQVAGVTKTQCGVPQPLRQAAQSRQFRDIARQVVANALTGFLLALAIRLTPKGLLHQLEKLRSAQDTWMQVQMPGQTVPGHFLCWKVKHGT